MAESGEWLGRLESVYSCVSVCTYFLEEVMFRLRPKGSDRAGARIFQEEKTEGKGPEASQCLEC